MLEISQMNLLKILLCRAQHKDEYYYPLKALSTKYASSFLFDSKALEVFSCTVKR